MSGKATPSEAGTHELRHDGTRQFLCTQEDFHKFGVSEAEAVNACARQKQQESERDELNDDFELNMRRIAEWCGRQPEVARCVVGLRNFDFLVAVTAKSEDDAGTLHDAMADLDLDLFQRTRFRLCFMLFRASEAEGASAFVTPDKMWTLYLADRK